MPYKPFTLYRQTPKGLEQVDNYVSLIGIDVVVADDYLAASAAGEIYSLVDRGTGYVVRSWRVEQTTKLVVLNAR